MNAHRLRAPSADGALLAEPPLAEAAALLAANADRLAALGPRLPGPARLLAPPGGPRARCSSRPARSSPTPGSTCPGARPADRLVVTGHQPELFHPGVWVKNFAAAAIAREPGGSALNLIVDNDIPKSSTVRVPRRRRRRAAGRAGRLRRLGRRDPLRRPRRRRRGASSPRSPTGSARPSAGRSADPVLDEFWPQAPRLRAG